MEFALVGQGVPVSTKRKLFMQSVLHLSALGPRCLLASLYACLQYRPRFFLTPLLHSPYLPFLPFSKHPLLICVILSQRRRERGGIDSGWMEAGRGCGLVGERGQVRVCASTAPQAGCLDAFLALSPTFTFSLKFDKDESIFIHTNLGLALSCNGDRDDNDKRMGLIMTAAVTMMIMIIVVMTMMITVIC